MVREASTKQCMLNGTQMERSVVLTPELLEEVLACIQKNGRTSETIQAYERKLYQLYEWLPADKKIEPGTLEKWRNSLVETGYAARTVNLCMSAANSMLQICGRRDLQIGKPLQPENDIQPELTRNEYLRLLFAARSQDKEPEYLLIKVFATTGINVRDLHKLTISAVRAGRITLLTEVVRVPSSLCEELLDYAKRKKIYSGPVFINRNGTPCTRTAISTSIRRLFRDAQVPEEKTNPRCLRRLYQTTQASIQTNISMLMDEAHDRLLETEQLAIGWKQGGESNEQLFRDNKI